MLKSYFKIAWRNIWKNKVFSFINIFGLSVGIAFTLLIGAYVWGELQVNQQLKDADNQYIIMSKWKDPAMGADYTSIAQLSRALKDNYPGLVANYYNSDPAFTNVSKGDMHFHESLLVGDSTLLNMYGFKLLYGDAKTALIEPYSVVITAQMAKKYFGRTDVVGQTLNFESFAGSNHDFMVTAVLDELSRNTITDLNGRTIQFFFNASVNKFFERGMDGWDNSATIDHIELKQGIDPKAVERAMVVLLKKNASDDINQNLTPYLLKMKDYNLLANNGTIKKMTWTLSCIALFILLMAVINFVNICIGRASGRMKEMGIRKVMGSLRKQLIWQFLTESVLMVMLATILALIIYTIARPYFGAALGRDVMSLLAFPVYFMLIPFVFALLVGLLAGIYPALVLSALKSVDSLKGKLTTVKESVLFRKTLVAFQFTTAAVVFIGVVIISQQISLFFSSNLGYNKDYVIYAQLPRDWSPKGVKKMEAIRYQMAQMPQVSSVSLSFEIPDGINGGSVPVYKQGSDPSKPVTTQALTADNQYAATYNIPLKAGTFFSPVFNVADSTQIVINETEAKALGWNDPNDAIGHKIMYWDQPFTICGVTADFHFGSMQAKILPITFINVNRSPYYRYFSFRVKPGDLQKSAEALQKKWAELLPGEPFEYHFMDDALNRLYTSEIQLQKAAYIATVLSVIIVLLGVLGLISLSIQKRTKEIGIRKVLGSSVAGITTLFLKDFLGVVLIAGIIACPLAYLIMQKWLSDYAYRVNISFSPFVLSITLLVFITGVLIILQTIKAAFANPIKSLRSE
ncbi:ABC transporter permease [Mucilaginibacter sp. X5P1]|uniref:ABC transporter permease n=1 Tax=Mucilaginibacter sp. X5P1 TaxID=2723088 RepID=UPI0016125776|nr:ABC transporter permease [Mucilaginibacter sp. X5P1]MBB6138965.1 ABC-type antimicrobial peptide transport system permease subunit [Mucilaginibacter sp. X5P1]